MKFSITSAVAATLAVVNGLPTDISRSLDSLQVIGGVTWTGEVLPGKNATFSGTMQEVRQQILAENPNYFAEHVEESDIASGNHLDKRWALKQPPDCSYGQYMRRPKAIQFINQLNAKDGGQAMCGAPASPSPGQGGCSRLSCDWGSQMWLCNDNNYPLQLPCTEVASALFELSNVCYTVQRGGDTETQGQLFTTDNWNVIITFYGDCHSRSTVG